MGVSFAGLPAFFLEAFTAGFKDIVYLSKLCDVAEKAVANMRFLYIFRILARKRNEEFHVQFYRDWNSIFGCLISFDHTLFAINR